MAQVLIENLYKTFPSGASSGTAQGSESHQSGSTVLKRINLRVEEGEFMVLVGPSGCGKSTLLRLIAGLESITAGQIWVGDRLVNDLPPKQRDIAMVFQSYALYPHLTVYDNLAFGLRRMGGALPPALAEPDPNQELGQVLAQTTPWQTLLGGLTRPLPRGLRYRSRAEHVIEQRVRAVGQMLQIDGLLNRYPRQLSGGQKQRVALGRAMARNPQAFLMDEPLSNLDAKLRMETRAQIVNLQRQLGITTIYVTHDQVEAMTMGHRIAVINQGQIQQVAPPLDLYRTPANRFVAEFIGSPPMNFIPVQVQAPYLVTHPHFRLSLPSSWRDPMEPYDGRSLLLGIRPEHLSLALPAPKNIRGQVLHQEALGSETYLTVGSPGLTVQARVPPEPRVALGEEVWLAIAPEQVQLFDPSTEQSLRSMAHP